MSEADKYRNTDANLRQFEKNAFLPTNTGDPYKDANNAEENKVRAKDARQIQLESQKIDEDKRYDTQKYNTDANYRDDSYKRRLSEQRDKNIQRLTQMDMAKSRMGIA
jgi:hypothetical protein